MIKIIKETKNRDRNTVFIVEEMTLSLLARKAPFFVRYILSRSDGVFQFIPLPTSFFLPLKALQELINRAGTQLEFWFRNWIYNLISGTHTISVWKWKKRFVEIFALVLENQMEIFVKIRRRKLLKLIQSSVSLSLLLLIRIKASTVIEMFDKHFTWNNQHWFGKRSDAR